MYYRVINSTWNTERGAETPNPCPRNAAPARVMLYGVRKEGGAAAIGRVTLDVLSGQRQPCGGKGIGDTHALCAKHAHECREPRHVQNMTER